MDHQPSLTGHTGDVPLPVWSCNGATSLPHIYTGGPDVRFVGPNPAGAFGSAYTLGDLDGNGLPDLFVSEPLPYEEIQGDLCLYSPGDGGGYRISDPLAGGALEDVAVRFPAQITGCPDVPGDQDRYGAAISITAQDYTGDARPELVMVGPSFVASWIAACLSAAV